MFVAGMSITYCNLQRSQNSLPSPLRCVVLIMICMRLRASKERTEVIVGITGSQ